MRALTILGLAVTLAACARADEAAELPAIAIDPAVAVLPVDAGNGGDAIPKPVDEPPRRRRGMPREDERPEVMPGGDAKPADGAADQPLGEPQGGERHERRGRVWRHRRGGRGGEEPSRHGDEPRRRGDGDHDDRRPRDPEGRRGEPEPHDGEDRPERRHGGEGRQRKGSHSHSHSHSHEHEWGHRHHFRRGCATKALGMGFLLSTTAAVVLAIKNRRLRRRLAALTAAQELAVPVPVKSVDLISV